MPESMTCAVIIKMMSSTSTTSTKGVTLISESAVVPWNRRRTDAPPLLTVIAIRSPSVSAFRQIEELEREVVHTGAHFLDDVAEVVVGDGRGNSREKAYGSGDQRLGNPGANGAQTGAPSRTELFKGADNAQYGSEQSDERTHRRGCGQPAHVAFQFARRWPRDFRGADRHCRRPFRGYSRGRRLQLLRPRHQGNGRPYGRLHARVPQFDGTHLRRVS